MIHWIIVQWEIKIMNMFLTFGDLLKWTLWKIIMMLHYRCRCLKLLEKNPVNSFELDHVYYLSNPAYGWNAMLMFIDVNLKIMPGIKKYQFIESIQFIRIHWLMFSIKMTFNNKFFKLSDSDNPAMYVIYLDASNLYGHMFLWSVAKRNW